MRRRTAPRLKSRGIHAAVHYVRLPTSPMDRKLRYQEGGPPVTEAVSRRGLRLPFYSEITEKEQK